MPEDNVLTALLKRKMAEVTDRMKGRAFSPEGSDELIPPAAPSIFQDEPLAVGSPEFARAVHATIRDFPGVARKGVPRVIQGPTNGSMRVMLKNQHPKLNIDDFADTTLLGVTDTRNNEIGINPKLKGSKLYGTLAHEFSHAVGSGEDSAYPIGDQYGPEKQTIELDLKEKLLNALFKRTGKDQPALFPKFQK